jgi:hypothetical protein
VFVGKIKNVIATQKSWLEEMEKSMIDILNDIVKQRYMKELAATNVLYSIIQAGSCLFCRFPFRNV